MAAPGRPKIILKNIAFLPFAGADWRPADPGWGKLRDTEFLKSRRLLHFRLSVFSAVNNENTERFSLAAQQKGGAFAPPQ
jgi:hypothetical protein